MYPSEATWISSPNSRYLLRFATPADSVAIGKVLESGSFPGKISVKFTREPDTYNSFLMDGDDVVFIVGVDRQTDEIVAVGGCSIRQAYVNGQLTSIGYLTGLKVIEAHRKKRIPIKQAYALLHEQTKDRCSIYITTILSDNELAIRMLEKPRKDMPRYCYRDNYTVFCLGTGKKVKLLPDVFIGHGTADLKDFYRKNLPRFQFSLGESYLSRISEQDFYYLKSDAGEILAACALWNQQHYKQYVISGYSGVLRLLQKLPTNLLGYPKLPKENIPANYASIAMLIYAPKMERYAESLVRAVASEAASYDFVMLGLASNHPLHSKVQAMPHVKYESRVYTVDFGENASLLDEPIMLEVGVL